jgi:U8 snoRNA-decapping enzyme
MSNLSNLAKQSDNLNDWNEVEEAVLTNKLSGEQWNKIHKRYNSIEYDEAKKLIGYEHAAHCFIWAKNDDKLWGIDLNGAVSLQMRFDGYIGFPGGFIDETDASWEDGLNRELDEELNLNKKYQINKANYFFSSLNEESKVCLHFYVKEVALNELKEIECDAMNAKDHGGELLGMIRAPLYETSSNRGFPIFIHNRFVGNGIFQFLRTILILKLIPKQFMIDCLKRTELA